MRARLLHDGQHVVDQRLLHCHALYRSLQPYDVVARQHWTHAVGGGHLEIAQDLALAGRIRVAYAQAHQEAVHLRLRQRICAVVLHRILRGDHHKRARQQVRAPVDGHLALVHGFQQRRLRFGRSAIDLVRQQEIGEDRPRLEFERLGMRVVDSDPQHVAGQHVAGELQAVEAAGHRARQGLGQRGLPHARHIFDQQMAARQQADHREPYNFGLPPDCRLHGPIQFAQPGKQLRRKRNRRDEHGFPLRHSTLL